jgi:aspartyl-tRNA(Asn)/glutamyl-tRNA(Gln) amidotransferase subunit C
MITREDIENIALLSKLFVDEKDIDGLTEEMQKIVAFADTINSVDVKTGEFDNINNLSNAFRKDEVKESLPVEEILKNAPEQAEDHFLVRKRA